MIGSPLVGFSSYDALFPFSLKSFNQFIKNVLSSKPYFRKSPEGYFFVGCTDQEISEIQSKQALSRLPKAYVQFMLHFGRWIGGIWRDTSYYYDEVLDNKEIALEVTIEKKCPSFLDEKILVFQYLPYDVFYYIDVLESDDPNVFEVNLNECEIYPHGKFTEFVVNVITAYGKMKSYS